MRISKKLLAIITFLFITCFCSSLITATALQTNSEDKNPFDLLWSAITHLQSTIDDRVPKAGNITISPSAFGENFWYVIGSGDTMKDYSANVQLPQGARITKLTFYVNDKVLGSNGFTSSANLQLRKISLGNASVSPIDSSNMAGVTSIDTPSGQFFSSVSTTAITSNIVDNDNTSYFLVLTMPKSDSLGAVSFYSASIGYEY